MKLIKGQLMTPGYTLQVGVFGYERRNDGEISSHEQKFRFKSQLCVCCVFVQF